MQNKVHTEAKNQKQKQKTKVVYVVKVIGILPLSNRL